MLENFHSEYTAHEILLNIYQKDRVVNHDKYKQVEILKTCRLFKFAITFVKIYNILPAIFCLFIIVKGFCSFIPAHERKPFVASALIY